MKPCLFGRCAGIKLAGPLDHQGGGQLAVGNVLLNVRARTALLSADFDSADDRHVPVGQLPSLGN